MKEKMVGYVNVLLTMFVYAFSGVFIVGLAKYVGMYATIFWRGIFCLVISFGILWFFKAMGKPSFGYQGKFRAVDLLANYVIQPLLMVAWVLAVLLADANAALFFVLVSQQIVTFVINWWFKGRPDGLTIFANLMMLGGVLIYSWPLESIFNWGVFFALLYGLISGVRMAMLHEMKVSKASDRLFLLLMQSLVIVFVGWLMIKFGGAALVPTTGVPVEGWLVVLGASLVIIVTQFMEMFSLSKIDANITTVIMSSELAVAGLLNGYIVGQMMNTNQWIGSAILMLSMSIVPIVLYVRHKTQLSL